MPDQTLVLVLGPAGLTIIVAALVAVVRKRRGWSSKSTASDGRDLEAPQGANPEASASSEGEV